MRLLGLCVERLVGLCVLLATIWPAAACSQVAPAARARVDDKVEAIVAESGRARVLITLREPTGAPAEREAAIAAVQDEVLAGVAGKDFTLLRRYRSVPGLAAVVGRDALDVLRGDPRVLAIQVDETGRAQPGR